VGVVDIDTKLQYQNAAAAGTGMILTADGQVLTNNHVVEGATSIKVTVVSTGKTYSAVVLGTDPTDDVALLKMQDASGLQTVDLGTSSGLNVGDVVTSVGNAQGVGGTPTVASGTITGLDQDITASDPNGANAEQLNGLIETNANMQPGMSGGPLYDNDGKVVGMNTAGSSSGPRRRRGGTPAASGDNYAIPVDHALAIVKQIQSGQETDTIHIGYDGFLGVEVSQDTSSTPGAVISQILDGTPAANTDLQAGDVITGIDDTKVTDAASLGTVMDAHKPGDSVKVTWVDTDGKQQTATVTLATAPPD
jgi:S1-C subfamily serine protease